jgi:hypothetical protein
VINYTTIFFSRNTLEALLVIAKLLKCNYFYAYNYNNKNKIFGLGPDMSTFKYIKSENEINIDIPAPLSIMEKDLAYIVKLINENNLDGANVKYAKGYNNILFPKYIYLMINDSDGVPEFKPCISFFKGKEIYDSIYTEHNAYKSIEFLNLEDNDEFNNILQTKSKEGLSLFNIYNQTIQIMPSILGANKSDKVYFKIVNFKNYSTVIFKVNKKSKHCDIYIIYRIIPLIR